MPTQAQHEKIVASRPTRSGLASATGRAGDSSAEIIQLKIADIRVDAGTQARSAINPDTVSDYAEAMTEGAKFPPVIVFHDGTDYFLADGFHRVLAAARNGFVDIVADIRKGTHDDALWYAMGANRTNGQRMSRGDVAHAVDLALHRWPEKTQSEIARQIGCSQGYVSEVKTELIATDKLTLPATRTGTDGKDRPTTYVKREPVGETESDGAAGAGDGADTTSEGSGDLVEEPRRMPLYTLTVAAPNVKTARKKAEAAFGEDAIRSIEKMLAPSSRAERLAVAEGYVAQALELVQELQAEIENWSETMPENLKGGDKSEQVSAANEALQGIVDALEGVEFGEVEFPKLYG